MAPADLVLFLGITVMLLASGVVETRRLGLMARIAAAPVRRRTVVAALIATSLCVAAAQSAGLLLVGRVIFGVHWGNAVGVFLVVAMLSLAYAGAAALVSMRSRSEEQAISIAVVLGIVCGHARRLHVPPRRGGAGHPRRRPRRAPGLGHGRLREPIYNHAGLMTVLPQIGALAVFAVVLGALALRAYARTVYSPG